MGVLEPLTLLLLAELLHANHIITSCKPSTNSSAPTIRTQRRCQRSLDRSWSGYREGQRRRLELGEGNGFSFEAGPYCHYCNRNNVHALLSGEVSAWPGIDAVASAHDGALLPLLSAALLMRLLPCG